MTEKPTAAESARHLSANPGASAVHLRFLDGTRALAALYVMLYHLLSVVPQSGLPAGFRMFETLFWQGHLAVDVFIVLSGFVLMLPVVLSADGRLRGGLKEYFKRRAQRILIPYYAALALAVPTDLYRQRIHHETFPWGALVAHLLVIHDLRPTWVWRFEVPLWTVAVEWHIYFVFALVLLPVWRRFGIAASTIVALFLGGELLLSPYPMLRFTWVSPWFLGLFSLGNLAAYLAFTAKSGVRQRAERIPWGVLLLAFAVVVPFSLTGSTPFFHMMRDLTVGSSFACFLLYAINLNRRSTAKETKFDASFIQVKFIKWLGSPPLVGLSRFSYSLYLIHFPILSVLDTLFKAHMHSDTFLMAFQLIIVMPICLCTACLFSRVFEKPFVKKHTNMSTSDL